ncbi:hypothetical protein MASR2M79_22050 [Aminivibrio sp.]
MSSPLLEVRDLSVIYKTYEGTVAAVKRPDFSLEAGKTSALWGRAGRERPPRALSILGLILSPPGVVTSGEIPLFRQDLLALSVHRIQGHYGSSPNAGCSIQEQTGAGSYSAFQYEFIVSSSCRRI